MSTKCSLAFSWDEDSKYHLYEEFFDEENVYLQLCGKGIYFEACPDRIEVRIPKTIWEVIRKRESRSEERLPK